MAPFASKLVNYLRKSESLNIRKNSEIDDIFLRRQLIVDFQTYFKDSLCLEWSTNLGAKGAKRSVNMWNTNFDTNFFKNMLLKMNGWLSKIRSLRTYVMHRMFYFEWNCNYIQFSLKLCNHLWPFPLFPILLMYGIIKKLRCCFKSYCLLKSVTACLVNQISKNWRKKLEKYCTVSLFCFYIGITYIYIHGTIYF